MSREYGNPKPVKAAVYRQVVAEMAAAHKAPKRIAEIGIWAGALSKEFVGHCPDSELTIIDPWLAFAWRDGSNFHSQTEMDALALDVMRWAEAQTNVRVLRSKSLDAVGLFDDGYFDFIHFDHDKDPVTFSQDLKAWWPKLADGGNFNGDNYEDDRVSRPVSEMFPEHRTAAKGRVWWIVK